MTMRFALCGLALAAFVTPALAASEFYVVKDATTMKCSIVDAKPAVPGSVAMGTTMYTSQADAQTAMTAAKDCAAK